MFWDNVACVYDVFANVINRKTNEELCSVVKNLILPNMRFWNCFCTAGIHPDREIIYHTIMTKTV